MSEYNQVEYPVSYFLWTMFSVILTSLIIVYSAVFSKYLLVIYLRSFLALFTSQINYAYSLPQGSEICVPTRGLIHGGVADIVFYQTYDKTWVTARYVVKNPLLRTVGSVGVSAPIHGYFATHRDPVSGKYIAVNYLLWSSNGLEYQSPYSDFKVTDKNLQNGTYIDLMQTFVLTEDWEVLHGANVSVVFPVNSWLLLWYKDVGVPVAVCFEKRDGLLVIKDVKNTEVLGS